MADLQKTIEIIFQGTDRIGGTVRGIESALGGLKTGVADVTAPLAALADSILAVNAAVNLLAAGGIVLAITTAGQFGDAFGEISTLITATDDELAAFRQSILDYAKVSTASIDDINAAVYTAISAGTKYTDALDLLSTSEKLSTAGRADLEATTRLLASTLNAYGESAEQAGHYSDVFFTTVKLGQTTIPELAQSLSSVTGIAANAGVPIETLTAAIAALTAAGAPTAEAVTFIKGALTGIISPSSEAAKTAAELGIEFNATALKTKGFEGVLKDVHTATGGNVEIMASLFGNVRGLNAALVLGADSSGKFAGALEEMRNATGATDEAFAKMADRFSQVNQTLANTVHATLIEAGTKMMDTYGDIAGEAAGLFGSISFSLNSGAFDPIFDALNAFGGNLADVIAVIARNLPEAVQGLDFSGLIDSYRDLGAAFMDAVKAITGPIDLSTPEGLRKALQKVVDLMELLTRATGGVIEGLTPFFQAVGRGIEKLSRMDGDTANLAGTIIGLGKGINTVVNNLGLLTGALTVMAGSSAVNAVASMGKLVTSTGLLSASSAALTTGVTALGVAAGGTLAAGVGYAAGKVIDHFVPGIGDAVGKVIEWSDGILDWSGNQRLFNRDLEETEQRFQEAKETARSYHESLKATPETVETHITVSGTSEAAEDIKSLLGLTSQIEELDNYLDSALSDLVIRPEIDDAGVENVTGTLRDIPKNAFGDKEYRDGEVRYIVGTAVDRASTKTTIADLDDVKAKADVLKTAFEWNAKLEIAQIEGQVRIIETMFGSIDNAIKSSGDLLSDLWGTMGSGDLDIGEKWELSSQLRDENRRREEQFGLQKQLIEQQLEMNDLKLDRLRKGDALITITGDGLEPEIEAFMWKILENIQVRATEEGSEFLLGI